MRDLLRQQCPLWMVAIGLVWTLAGCDLTDVEEDVEPLLGSWRVINLSVDDISVKEQLDTQYDRLVLTLRQGARGGEFFTLLGRTDGTQEDLFRQGRFDVDNDELDLYPDNGPQVEFDYAIPDSLGSRLQLTAEEGASEDQFLQLIEVPIQGAVDRVDVSLSRRQAPSTQRHDPQEATAPTQGNSLAAEN